MSDSDSSTSSKNSTSSKDSKSSGSSSSSSNSGSDSNAEKETIGPSITDAVPAKNADQEDTAEPPKKKQKVLPYEQLYLENLPSTDCYEKSFMHRDVISYLVATKTDFIVTGSIDGHVKFWKKMEEGIEFVKHFRSHLGPVVSLSANANGTYLCSASSDKSLKIFDVVNFDCINMFKLEYQPLTTEWVHAPGDAIFTIAVSELDSPKIHIYDAQGTNSPLNTLEKFHAKPINVIKFNVPFETAISIDKSGLLEYWQSSKHDYKFPTRRVAFESKLDTSLFEFVKHKTHVISLDFSPNGKRFATLSADRKVRVFSFITGKLLRVYDENLVRYTEQQQTAQAMPNMEFGRRMASERDIEKSNSLATANIIFDASGHFILYSTMLGIKVVNVETNRCVKILGKGDNIRPLHLALFQGRVKRSKAAITLEQEASDNPVLNATNNDPILFCTAYKKQRFYLYSRRLPSDLQDVDRDVFNEKPNREDIIAATENQGNFSFYFSPLLLISDYFIFPAYASCQAMVIIFTCASHNI